LIARKQIAAFEKEREKEVRSVEEGAEAYIPRLSYHARLDRKLEAFLKKDKQTVLVDGNTAVANLDVHQTKPGSVFLGAGWQGYGYSQINLADDVYDAVFSELKIEELLNDKSGGLPVLYDLHYTGFTKLKYQMKRRWDTVINWAVSVF
jgi:hypothetical protein